MQWIGQAWSLLWRSTPPALWNSLLEKMHHYSWLPHNFPFPHMPSLKAETHNQTGIKTTIPPEFAYYVPNALMSEWEYYLRGKLLKHCRPDSSCADLKEKCPTKTLCPCSTSHAEHSSQLSWGQRVDLTYARCTGWFHTASTALPGNHTCCNAGCFCRVFNSSCWTVFQPIQRPGHKMHWTSVLLCG